MSASPIERQHGATIAPGAPPAVEIADLTFEYKAGRPVLNIPSLTVHRGRRVFLYGPSGSGKTTLLGILAGVLPVQGGSVRVFERELGRLTSAGRDEFRAVHIGYIFQMFNLIPYLSVLENVTLPCRLNSRRRARAERNGESLTDAAHRIASHLEIEGLLGSPVTELSVGQQQRVAAARALLGAPELVIADEPTSALDNDRRQRFLELLFGSCAESGSTLIFVSHDRTLQPLFDEAVSLPDVNRGAVPAAV
ncbi:MAG TPA: ABC transporter ATP-binding protein [Gemmatimonadales bacterium]|nr:ABC transporter ATP-binding protein [Gemmatimonadales bacterium]